MGALRVAVHGGEFCPPVEETHVHDVDAPCAGKGGVPGVAVPFEQSGPEKDVSAATYARAAGPHTASCGVCARVAPHGAVEPPFVPRHSHVVVPPAGGNGGLAGTAEPETHAGPPKLVAVAAYIPFAAPHAPLITSTRFAKQLAGEPPKLPVQAHMTVAPA